MPGGWHRFFLALSWLWVAVVIGYLAWGAVNYSGLYRWLAGNDPSRLPWNSTDRLQTCFARYWEQLDRNVDFVTDSFVATPDPSVASQYTSANYRFDPLARLGLSLSNNQGDSIDVVRTGAFCAWSVTRPSRIRS